MATVVYRPLHDCDETCRCCGRCYQSSGYEVCNQQCEHATCRECDEPVSAGRNLCAACEDEQKVG